EAVDPVSDLARALQQREADLDERAAALDARETRLNLRQSELDRQSKNLEEIRASVETALDQLDAAQQQGLEEVARSLAVMDPDEAGADLERMDPAVAARILPLIPRDDRGPILDAIMDKERRVQILDLMHARTN